MSSRPQARASAGGEPCEKCASEPATVATSSAADRLRGATTAACAMPPTSATTMPGSSTRSSATLMTQNSVCSIASWPGAAVSGGVTAPQSAQHIVGVRQLQGEGAQQQGNAQHADQGGEACPDEHGDSDHVSYPLRVCATHFRASSTTRGTSASPAR